MDERTARLFEALKRANRIATIVTVASAPLITFVLYAMYNAVDGSGWAYVVLFGLVALALAYLVHQTAYFVAVRMLAPDVEALRLSEPTTSRRGKVVTTATFKATGDDDLDALLRAYFDAATNTMWLSGAIVFGVLIFFAAS
ncbi:MAG: hypothetical protein AAFR04_13245 [Pseudomonadota bacterium]